MTRRGLILLSLISRSCIIHFGCQGEFILTIVLLLITDMLMIYWNLNWCRMQSYSLWLMEQLCVNCLLTWRRLRRSTNSLIKCTLSPLDKHYSVSFNSYLLELFDLCMVHDGFDVIVLKVWYLLFYLIILICWGLIFFYYIKWHINRYCIWILLSSYYDRSLMQIH